MLNTQQAKDTYRVLSLFPFKSQLDDLLQPDLYKGMCTRPLIDVAEEVMQKSPFTSCQKAGKVSVCPPSYSTKTSTYFAVCVKEIHSPFRDGREAYARTYLAICGGLCGAPVPVLFCIGLYIWGNGREEAWLQVRDAYDSDFSSVSQNFYQNCIAVLKKAQNSSEIKD